VRRRRGPSNPDNGPDSCFLSNPDKKRAQPDRYPQRRQPLVVKHAGGDPELHRRLVEDGCLRTRGGFAGIGGLLATLVSPAGEVQERGVNTRLLPRHPSPKGAGRTPGDGA